MKPFVELGFMPNALASGSKTIFWWRGNVTPPKDMNKWADFIRAFVLHVQERYGDAEVRTWYFEVWNEPNLMDGFWAGTQQQYFDLYAATARAIKSVSAGLQSRRPGDGGLRLGAGVHSFLRHEPRAGGFHFHAHLWRGKRLSG